MSSSHLKALAEFVAGLEISRLPPGIVDAASACLLYGIAVGVASGAAEQPRTAARAQGLGAERAEATRLLDGAGVTAEEAAYANATLFHARCQEDAHPAGHFGAVILPAALAMAEATRASGPDLLAAIVAGYETALRIGRDHVVDLSARGFRSTSAYGVFGAAAAAARLRRLDWHRTAHALAIAANAACGLRAFVAAGSDEYAFHAGFAARNGLTAAALAANGAEASLDVLCGDAGFFAAYGALGRDYGKRIAEALGEQFEMEHVTFKPYPTCQFHRAVIAGLIDLRARAGTVPVNAIEIRMHPVEADFWGVRFSGPFRRFSQAFMSAPFCAAVAWLRGNVRFADLHDFGDPNVQAVVDSVTVVADPQRGRYDPSLTVSLADGSRLVSNGGGRDYTLTWESAVAMAHTLGTEVGVSDAIIDQLASSCKTIRARSEVSDLVTVACTATRAAAVFEFIEGNKS